MYKVFLFSLSLTTIIGLSIPMVVAAQDAPNTNVTKRRPDRGADYSPTPISSPTTQPVEVKQVETTQPSFFARLWTSIKSFFINLFKQPEASSTTTSPTP